MNRSRKAWSLVAVGVAVLVACVAVWKLWPAPKPVGGGGLKQVTFLLDWRSEPVYGGIEIAREQGLFKARGIDLTIAEGNGATLAAQAVGTGNQQYIGTCSAAATAIARSKGVPIRSAAVIYHETPTVIYSLARTPIRKPDDLIGRKIGLIQGSVTVDEYRALLTVNNIDRSKITEVSVGWDASALLNGQVDALMTYEDNVPVQLRLQGHDVVVLRMREFGVRLYSLNVIVNDRAANEHPEETRKVVEAVTEGYRFVRDHPEEAAQIYSRLHPERDPAYVRESMKVVAGLIGGDEVGQQTQAGWEQTLKTLDLLKLLEKPVSVEEVTLPGSVRK